MEKLRVQSEKPKTRNVEEQTRQIERMHQTSTLTRQLGSLTATQSRSMPLQTQMKTRSASSSLYNQSFSQTVQEQESTALNSTVLHSSSSRHRERGIEMNKVLDSVPDYRRPEYYAEDMTQAETIHCLRNMKNPPSLPKSQQTIMCTDDLKLVPIEKPKKLVKEKEDNGIWSSVKNGATSVKKSVTEVFKQKSNEKAKELEQPKASTSRSHKPKELAKPVCSRAMEHSNKPQHPNFAGSYDAYIAEKCRQSDERTKLLFPQTKVGQQGAIVKQQIEKSQEMPEQKSNELENVNEKITESVKNTVGELLAVSEVTPQNEVMVHEFVSEKCANGVGVKQENEVKEVMNLEQTQEIAIVQESSKIVESNAPQSSSASELETVNAVELECAKPKEKEIEVKELECAKPKEKEVEGKELPQMTSRPRLSQLAFDLVKKHSHLFADGSRVVPIEAIRAKREDPATQLITMRHQVGGGNIASNGQQNQQPNEQQNQAQIPNLNSAQMQQGMEQGLEVVIANVRRMEQQIHNLTLTNQQLENQVAEIGPLRQQNQTQATTIETMNREKEQQVKDHSEIVQQYQRETSGLNRDLRERNEENEALKSQLENTKTELEKERDQSHIKDETIQTLTEEEAKHNSKLDAKDSALEAERETSLMKDALIMQLIQRQMGQPVELSQDQLELIENIQASQHAATAEIPMEAEARMPPAAIAADEMEVDVQQFALPEIATIRGYDQYNGSFEFQVNREQFARNSTHLRNLLDAKTENGVTSITFRKETKRAMTKLMNWIENDQIEGSTLVLFEVYNTAKHLQIDRLMDDIVAKFLDTLDTDNCMARLGLAMTTINEDPEVENSILDYISGLSLDEMTTCIGSTEWIDFKRKNDSVTVEAILERVAIRRQNPQ